MVHIIGKNNQLTKEQLLSDPKIQNVNIVGESIHFLKRQKPLVKIGVYLGRFDSLTPKDAVFLSLAKTKCDILIVVLETSYSLKLKQQLSMISYGEKERAFLVASLPFVDWVVSYDEETPDFALATLNPDKIFYGLYSDDETLVTSKKDKLEKIEHPFSLTDLPKKKIPLKYFDIPTE